MQNDISNTKICMRKILKSNAKRWNKMHARTKKKLQPREVLTVKKDAIIKKKQEIGPWIAEGALGLSDRAEALWSRSSGLGLIMIGGIRGFLIKIKGTDRRGRMIKHIPTHTQSRRGYIKVVVKIFHFN